MPAVTPGSKGKFWPIVSPLELVQVYSYTPLPPWILAMICPVDSPKQLTSITFEKSSIISLASLTVTVDVSAQPSVSVIITS